MHKSSQSILTILGFFFVIKLSLIEPAGIAADLPHSLVPRTYQRLTAGQPITLVCLGDSVTGVYYHSGGRHSYPELLEQALKRQFPIATIRVINAGISGDTTDGGLKRLQNDVLQQHPDIVTVMFGLNDMTKPPVERYLQNLTDIARQIKASGAEVLICTPNDIEDSTERPHSTLVESVAALRNLCETQKLPMADVFAEFESVRQKSPLEFHLLLSDVIHPNLDGDKQIASVIAQAIAGRAVATDLTQPAKPLSHTSAALLTKNQPIKVLAMPPFDSWAGPALKKLAPDAQIDVTTWQVEGKTPEEVEAAAKKVRAAHPDLVIVAVPFFETFKSDELFSSWYNQILGNSFSGGHQEWDVVAIQPSLKRPAKTEAESRQDELAQRLILAHDLSLPTISPASEGKPLSETFSEWLVEQVAPKLKELP